MEDVNAHHVEALKAEWPHMAAQATSRQHGVANQLGRIEGHLNRQAFDQNNALESSQTTWRSIQELKSRAAETCVVYLEGY